MLSYSVVKYVKQRLSTYSMRAGVPYPALKHTLNALDIAAQPRDALVRWREARRMSPSIWSGMIPREVGYRKIGPGDIPGLDRFVATGRKVYEESRELHDRGRNPFHKLCTPETFRRHPELLEFAVSEPVIAAVTGYFGSVPRLSYADVWVTRPNLATELYNSQLYHLDKPDEGVLSLFVNVFDVMPEHGPFTFLPADVSLRVRQATKYDRLAILGDGRLADDDVWRQCRREDEISLAGPAGAGGFVDTSVCLHAGSRCEAGERVVLVLRYMPAFRTAFSDDDFFDIAETGNTQIRTLVAPKRR